MATWNRKSNGKPYIDYMVGGKRCRESLLRVDDTSYLDDKECQRRFDSWTSNHIPALDNTAFVSLVPWYVDVIQVARGCVESTRDLTRHDLGLWVEYCNRQGVLDVATLEQTPGAIDLWVGEMLTRYSTNTVRRQIANLKAMLRAAWERGIIDVQPVRAWPRLQPKRKQISPLTPQEVGLVLREVQLNGGQWYRPLAFIAMTGCRPIDATRLEWRHIFPEYIEITQAKTGQPVRIPLTGTLTDLLGPKQALSAPVFLNPTGRVCLPRVLSGVLADCATRAIGIPVRCRVLRQSVTTWAIRQGYDRSMIGALTGHRSDAIDHYIGLGENAAGQIQATWASAIADSAPQAP